MADIEIKRNKTITNDPCAICGQRCDPRGIDPFIAGTKKLVCDECARREGLGDLLDKIRAGQERTPYFEVRSARFDPGFEVLNMVSGLVVARFEGAVEATEHAEALTKQAREGEDREAHRGESSRVWRARVRSDEEN